MCGEVHSHPTATGCAWVAGRVQGCATSQPCARRARMHPVGRPPRACEPMADPTPSHEGWCSCRPHGVQRYYYPHRRAMPSAAAVTARGCRAPRGAATPHHGNRRARWGLRGATKPSAHAWLSRWGCRPCSTPCTGIVVDSASAVAVRLLVVLASDLALSLLLLVLLIIVAEVFTLTRAGTPSLR